MRRARPKSRDGDRDQDNAHGRGNTAPGASRSSAFGERCRRYRDNAARVSRSRKLSRRNGHPRVLG